MKRVPGERNLPDHLTKCNDELTCVVGAPMKGELLQQGDRTWQEEGSPRGVNFARRVRAVEERNVQRGVRRAQGDWCAMALLEARSSTKRSGSSCAAHSRCTEKQMGQQKQSGSGRERQRHHSDSGTGRQSAWRRKQWWLWPG